MSVFRDLYRRLKGSDSFPFAARLTQTVADGSAPPQLGFSDAATSDANLHAGAQIMQGLQALGILRPGDGQLTNPLDNTSTDWGLLRPLNPGKYQIDPNSVIGQSWAQFVGTGLDGNAQLQPVAWGSGQEPGGSPGTGPLSKALTGSLARESQPATDPKGIFWDPYSAALQMGFRERPTWVTFGMLNQLYSRIVVIPALIQLRLRQIEGFSKRTTHKYEPGVRIRPKDREQRLSNADRRMVEKLEGLIFRSEDPSRGLDAFETLNKKMVWNQMLHDQVTVQRVCDHSGRPVEWYHMDATMMRLAALPTLGPDQDPDRPYLVQLKDGVVVETFTTAEVAFLVSNPRVDLYGYGYGTPEAEMMLSALISFLNVWNHNTSRFTIGTMTDGMINLGGPRIPKPHLEAFREEFYLMTSGAANSFRVPIVNLDGQAQYIPFGRSNKEMEFSSFLDLLLKFVCSAWSTDPIEINFMMGGGGQAKQMFAPSNRSKVMESKERGLRPRLRMLERFWNHEIELHSPDFCLEFVGLETMTQKEQADLDTQLVRSTMTVNEVRKKNHWDPLPPKLGDIILEPNWLANRAAVQAQEKADKAEKLAQSEKEAQLAVLIGLDEASDLTPEDKALLVDLLNGAGQPDAGGLPPVGPTGGNPPPGGSSLPPTGLGGGPGGGRTAPTIDVADKSGGK